MLIDKISDKVSSTDVLVLPEHFSFDSSFETYIGFITELAQTAGCNIIGGSFHRDNGGKRINFGCAVDARGELLGTYQKLRPYFNEQLNVSAGEAVGEFEINGKKILVLICADFWYSDIILNAKSQPDLLLVPALSVSRKPGAEYSRTLWKHLAISRSYEFGVYIGISDWAEDSVLPKNRTCGVGGLADPTKLEPELFFQPISNTGVSIYSPDFEKLERFREDRRMRGFFWK